MSNLTLAAAKWAEKLTALNKLWTKDFTLRLQKTRIGESEGGKFRIKPSLRNIRVAGEAKLAQKGGARCCRLLLLAESFGAAEGEDHGLRQA